MQKQAFLAFGTDPHRAMPPIQCLQRFLTFFHADGRQHRNHQPWNDGTNHGTLFHLEQHLRKLFGALSMRFSRHFLRMKVENQHFPQMKIIWHKIKHLHATKSIYDAKTKSLMCQNSLFTICLSLVHDVLDRSKSTSTYCWIHLLTNSENIVAHLIVFCNYVYQHYYFFIL